MVVNLLPFSTQQSKPLIQMDGFYAKETKYSPAAGHCKDYGAMAARGGFKSCLNKLFKRYTFLDFNVKPKEGSISSWPRALEAHRDWILSRTGRGNPILNRIFNGFDIKAQQEGDKCQRF